MIMTLNINLIGCYYIVKGVKAPRADFIIRSTIVASVVVFLNFLFGAMLATRLRDYFKDS